MRRECGGCTLCCTLVPVSEIAKPANTKCMHQNFKGCRIYGQRGMPSGCRIWMCRWLVNDDMTDQRRPDRSHLVVDVIPDFITHKDHQTGVETKVPVIQVWVDPKHPDAWREPEFRDYMMRVAAARGCAFLVRNGNDSAIAVFPPTYFNPPAEDRWIEIVSNMRREKQHTFEEITQALKEHTNATV